MTSGSPAADLDTFVTASLLRLGGDSRPARLFKTLKLMDEEARVPLLSGALEARPAVRQRMVAEAHQRTAQALARAGACAAVPLLVGRQGYPPRLLPLPDPPIVLWARGQAGVLADPAVAIVGSRRATSNGLALANRLGRDLARAGVVVVSGMARGIDAAAHRGALEGGGRTVGVLGNGVDVVYPREQGDLFDRVLQAGCLVSELPPGALPLPMHFPLRNRVISGLSLAVVVVEAAERSGSLITARLALEQGREVLAVPGGVVSGCHRGCHALIKDGAGLVETAQDVLDALGWTCRQDDVAPAAPEGILAAMRPGEPVGLDDLAERTARPAIDLLAELGEREVAGQVARLPGGLFLRLD